jgi:hypothetical protein
VHPIRNCAGCAQSDDHPRHVIALPDGNQANYHMDCHAMIANCEVCHAQLEGVGGVEGNPKGQTLRDHLVTTGPGADQPGWTAPADDEIVEG